MSSITSSQFGKLEDIYLDLFGNKGTITNSEDALLKSLQVKFRFVLSNMLRPFQDQLPMAPASIYGDLDMACNLLVEMEWHRIKTHWDDYKNAKTSFDTVWNSIVTYLKALPTARTQPVSVTGDFSSSSVLMKNILNLTDSNGNILDSF